MNYKQVIEQESQETNINIDYFDKKVRINTSKATVMNRMKRYGFKPNGIETINGEICSATYEFNFDNFPRFISSSRFKCD